MLDWSACSYRIRMQHFIHLILYIRYKRFKILIQVTSDYFVRSQELYIKYDLCSQCAAYDASAIIDEITNGYKYDHCTINVSNLKVFHYFIINFIHYFQLHREKIACDKKKKNGFEMRKCF